MVNAILNTLTVLALCVGLSGCWFPARDWQGNQRDNPYGHGYRERSGRDCSSGDNHWNCRGGD